MPENGDKKDAEWCDYRQLCHQLAISRPTAERLVASGLPCLRIGRLVRFRLAEVIAWLQRRPRKP